MLKFGENQSLLERTIGRVDFADEVLILTQKKFKRNIDSSFSDAHVIAEPKAKDTGPAIGYAAWQLKQRYKNAIMFVVPSDHRILDTKKFVDTIQLAAEVAATKNKLLTIGVEPDRPETSYGYILPEYEDDSSPVKKFIEKPSKKDANQLINSGALWNTGIFVWSINLFLSEIKKTPLKKMLTEFEAGDIEAGYDTIDPISIDYALMERTNRAHVVKLDATWSDLGTWDVLGRVFADNAKNENIKIGNTEITELNSSSNVIAAPENHVSLIGVNNLVVASYDDRILVAPRDESDKLRRLVGELQESDQF